MIRKFALGLALVIVVWLLLIAVVVGFVEGTLWLTGILGLQHALGMDTQTTHNYASVSGVLPMVIALLGFSGILVTAWRRINCAAPGCLRVGKHPTADGLSHLCAKHHPDLPDGRRESLAEIHERHHAAKNS